MTIPAQWQRGGPRPDPKVLELVERLREAAIKGHIRAMTVVTINPLLEVEKAQAGELDNVRRHLMIGGLAVLKALLEHQITE